MAAGAASTYYSKHNEGSCQPRSSAAQRRYQVTFQFRWVYFWSPLTRNSACILMACHRAPSRPGGGQRFSITIVTNSPLGARKPRALIELPSFLRPTASLNCCGRVRNATWMPPSVSNGHCTAGRFSDLWRRPPTLSRAGERQRKRIACDSTATLEGFRDFVPRQDACYCRNAVTADQAPLAQLVEQLTLNQRVRGSKP